MRNKSILLVDDEKIILDSLGRDLELEKYAVARAASGEEALALLQAGHYDLVITDLVMGGINGIRVLKKTREINPATAVFILTGYGDLDSAIAALRLGADDYLLKPCDTEELLIRISRCFEKQDAFNKLKVYEEFLPICCMCGKIRDDRGVGHGEGIWLKIDEFIRRRTNLQVTHSYCPTCYEKEMKKIDG